MSMHDPIFSTSDVCEIVDLSPYTLQKWLADGKLGRLDTARFSPGGKGRARRYSYADVCAIAFFKWLSRAEAMDRFAQAVIPFVMKDLLDKGAEIESVFIYRLYDEAQDKFVETSFSYDREKVPAEAMLCTELFVGIVMEQVRPRIERALKQIRTGESSD